ncbi:MAG: hypothetical protein JXA54_10235 [Candidatus Heimdallarchaeota archaeon]|nr:hypothetical protein [Candidatus Heimdallarchaeota archaeon]
MNSICLSISEPILQGNIIFSETFDENNYSDWKLVGNNTNVISTAENGYLQLNFFDAGYCSYTLSKNFTDFECYFDAKLSISDLKGITGIGCYFYNSSGYVLCGFTFYLADVNSLFSSIANFPVYPLGTLISNDFFSISEKVTDNNKTYIPYILETATSYDISSLSYYQIKLIVQNFDSNFIAQYDDIYLTKEFGITVGPNFLYLSVSFLAVLVFSNLLNNRLSKKK